MRGQTVRNLALVTGLAGSLAMGAALAQPAQPLPSHIMAVPLDAPSVRIANGMIGAQIYLTDSAKGFYRGTRFDQSGVVGSLTFGSQDFYGPWFDHVSPDVLDFIFTPDGIIGGPEKRDTQWGQTPTCSLLRRSGVFDFCARKSQVRYKD